MAPLQVVGAGLGRTATDSLREALTILGYNTHHMKSIFMDLEQSPDDFYNASKNNGETDWDRIYAKYDAAVDWPTCTFYKQLMEKYPDAKVILTVRSADSWYQSVKNSIMQVVENSDIYKEGKAADFKRMKDHVILNGALSDPEKFKKEEEVKQAFLDHNEQVKNNVPAERLYVMQVGEGWEGLCQFLGKNIPDVPYPRLNSQDAFQKNVSLFAKRYG